MAGISRSGTTNVLFVTTQNIEKVKLWLNSSFYSIFQNVLSKKFYCLHSTLKNDIYTIRDSRTPGNITPESGVGVDIF
jgi:hypothetical protein